MSGPKTPSLIDLAMKYDNDAKCLALLESLRWPNGPSCPKCECAKAYRIESRLLFECGDCRHQYSATSGTIMHRSHLPLTKWILAAVLLCNGRKGVSACQVSRDLHITYKTAWYLCHRLRRAMREHGWLQKFQSIVELDETYVGGKAHGFRGRGAKKKTPVFGARERGGHVRLECMPRITSRNIKQAVREYVDPNCETVMADELRSYDQLASEFTLARINHSKEYVRGHIHTNSIESIWAILKRQVYGTHHKMSPQYLPLYLNEVSYRFNYRDDHELFLRVLRNALIPDRQIA